MGGEHKHDLIGKGKPLVVDDFLCTKDTDCIDNVGDTSHDRDANMFLDIEGPGVQRPSTAKRFKPDGGKNPLKAFSQW
jgi:hypothetical protein